jgi:hypothetical protein
MAIKINNTTVIDDNRLILPVNSSEVAPTVSISVGELALNLLSGTVFTVNMNSNITSMTITNVQSTGRTNSFVLVLVADGTARTVIWPNSFKWPSGTAPTLTETAGKRDVFTFFTTDGGSNWQAFITGQDI